MKTHPLKYQDLKETVEEICGLVNPDIWIEDLRRYGPCVRDNKPVEPEIVCKEEDTDALKASFSTIVDKEKNRVIIRHHY